VFQNGITENSMMHTAAIVNNVSCIDGLHSYGLSLDVVDIDGDTSLMYACIANQYDVAKKLILKGSSINKRNKKGENALMGAGFFLMIG
jgi:ankyrin repeat protein